MDANYSGEVMNEKTKTILKKVIMYFVIALVLFCAGICTERCRCNRSLPESGELTTELERAKAELEQWQRAYEQQLTQLDTIRKQADGVKDGIDESLRIAGQADESLRRARDAIQRAGETTGGIRDTLEQLRITNQELAVAVGELQTQNTRLTEELRRIQSGFTE